MTAVRLIPLPLHAALRMSTGLLTMVVPFVAGFSTAATLVCVVVGAVVAGIALMAAPDERGLPGLPVATLYAFDWGSTLGLFGAALVMGLAGDGVALLGMAAISIAQAAGNLTTRYSARV